VNHAEEDLYLAKAPLLLRQFATVMVDTGMRPEEVCRMRWENVHLEPVSGSRFGYVHNPKGKTKWAKRNLSLTARVQGPLSMVKGQGSLRPDGYSWRRSGGHVSYSTIDSQHGRTIEKLNAPDAEGNKPKNPIVPFRLYDLRHTFLTRLGEANADPFSIQRIAGHSSIIVSQKYVHPTPERLEEAFSRLESYNETKNAEMKAKHKTEDISLAVN